MPEKPEIIAPDSARQPTTKVEDSKAPQPEQVKPSADSVKKGNKLPDGKRQFNSAFWIVIVAVAIIVGLFMAKVTPRHPKKAGPQQTALSNGMRKPSAIVGTNVLPNQSPNASSPISAEGGNHVSAEQINRLASEGSSSSAYNSSASPASSNSHTKLGGVPPFSPPPTPSQQQWSPPPYSAGGSGAAQSANVERRIEREREEALTGKSLVFVAKEKTPAQAAASSTTATASVSNLGYATGSYLSTHLQTVASTAIKAPVVADVDYDYQRHGVTIIPAGSRLIGSMGASSETGIINLHFTQLRLPSGQTYRISAVGLNHQLMPLKGYVTGRHRFEQLLLAMSGGTASFSAMFAGNDVNGGFSEADLLRMEAANQAGSFANQQIGQIQSRVSRELVVTLPAGAAVDAMFTAPGTVGEKRNGAAGR